MLVEANAHGLILQAGKLKFTEAERKTDACRWQMAPGVADAMPDGRSSCCYLLGVRIQLRKPSEHLQMAEIVHGIKIRGFMQSHETDLPMAGRASFSRLVFKALPFPFNKLNCVCVWGGVLWDLLNYAGEMVFLPFYRYGNLWKQKA